MSKPVLCAALVALSLTIAGVAGAQEAAPPLRTGQTAAGASLVDPQGMTLYVFSKDTPGVSACKDLCANNWPPLAAANNAVATGDYAPLTRADGSRQWAFKGRPLYRFSQDQAPSDANGEGFLNGAWHVAAPR